MYMQLKLSAVALLSIVLLSCGGSGSGPSGAVNPPLTLASKFFVVDRDTSSIGSVENSDLPSGVLSFSRVLSGSNTGILGNSIRQMIYDNVNDDLYVANGTSVIVFSNASMASGDLAPARVISSSSISFIVDIFLDSTNDRLYVATGSPDKILVFNNASIANGTLVEDRNLSVSFNGGSFSISRMNVDADRDILYITGAGGTPTYSPRILVYDNAATLSGALTTADRAVEFNSSVLLGKAFLDVTNDRMYVAIFSDKTVRVFDSISTATGNIAANRVLTFSVGTPQITVDLASDRLYASTSAGGGLLVVANASTISGTVSPVSVSPPVGSYLLHPAVAP